MFDRVRNLPPLTALRGITHRRAFADSDPQISSPDGKPERIRKSGSLAELGVSLDSPDADAAYFEAPEAPNQELFKKHINALLSEVFTEVSAKLMDMKTSKTSRIRRVIAGAKDRLKLPKDSPARAELETLIDQVADDIAVTLSHFKGQKITFFTTKGSAGDGQSASYWHVDSYESGTTKVMRTYVGRSTEFALDFNGAGAVSPRNGAISVHKRTSSIHRAALLKKGEMRFAVAVSLAPQKRA